ncbi:MAG: ATP-binding protein [Gammaproteobacteria bacterium]
MAIRKKLRRALYALILIVGVLLWFSALLLFSQTAQDSEEFSRFQNWILLINLLGAVVLLLLILGSLVKLMREYRRRVPGSRLKTRMVTLLVVLAVTPLLVVYLFAVQFINRGIDSWFNVDVEQGLGTALELSRAALGIQMRGYVDEIEGIAARLGGSESVDIVGELSDLRRESQAAELTVFTANDLILATSSEGSSVGVPRYPSDEIVFQLGQGRPYVSLEPGIEGDYEILIAINITPRFPGDEQAVLQAVFPVEQRLSELANQVQASYDQYGVLSFLRDPLKSGFTVTLSLVLLIALLAAVYGAFFSAQRLVVPIQQLMAGTQAVARGDFDTLLPTPSHDEIGFLVSSFNDMTRRLSKASEDARSGQQQVESERKKLEVILARLKTGVVSLEFDLRIRTANQAASAILGVDLESHVGKPLSGLAASKPLLAEFLAVNASHLEQGESEWREQIIEKGEGSRRVLMCVCTALPSEGNSPSGYVVVFDEITALLQAQRDAAWGEVARRLAHEIKNPLTPIQLSAERLRRRYLPDQSLDSELLNRATRTIIQQVESMKEMVNAFSEYARTPKMELSRFNLNDLLTEVTELYKHQDGLLEINLSLDKDLPFVEADPGRMRQVFHNLIRNALEALEHQSDSRVDISTRHVKAELDAAEIKVSDNGPGFHHDIVGQAFEPYVTSKAKGTGLGLAIVKKLVDEHGGQITARNGEQGGAEISILLPIIRKAADAISSRERRQENWREHA